MGANTVIFNQLVRHQIRLRRLATGTVQDLSQTLSTYDAQIERLISQVHAGLSASQVEKIIKEVDKINEKAYVAVQAELKKNMIATSKHEVNYQGKLLKDATSAEVMRRMGVKGPSQKQLNDLVDKQPINGARLGEYVAGMEAGRSRRMRDAIRREHQMGGPGVEDGIRRAVIGSAFAHGMDGILGLSRRSLDQHTRTIQTGIVNNTRDLFYKENDALFAGVMWVSVLDMKTSDICQNLDGTVFPLDEGPRPPAHINCRSEITPIVKDWEALGLGNLGPGTREALDGEVPETMTYPEWLRGQSAEVQDEVLGPSRGELFRDGMTIDRFTDDTGRRYTLDELAQREGL